MLNRTSTTQPLVLSFKDEAVTTGTSASQNNFTIVATKPLLLDSFTKLNTSNATLTADNASVANDEKELQAMNGLDAMHANVTIYDTELDNLDPVLKDFNNQTVPIEEFFPQLKGSIGEGPNHSNFSDQSSVRIRSKFRNFCKKNARNI